MVHIQRLSAIFFILLFLQGCGFKFWYNRLDWAAAWYVEDYVALTDQQEQRLKQLIRRKLQWHRQQELPKYVDWLGRLKSDIEQGQIESRYDQHEQQMEQFYDTLKEQLIEDLAAMLLDMTDEQVAQLFKSLEEEQRDQRRRLKDRDQEDWLEVREDNIKESLVEWIGRLSKPQKALVRRWAQEYQPTLELQLEHEQIWLDNVQQALKNRHQPGSLDEIIELLRGGGNWQNHELKQRYQHNRQLEKRYHLALLGTLSDRQKRRLLSRLDDYREDFVDLIQEHP